MLRKCGRVCARSVRDSMTHRMITVITPPITPPITPSIPPQPHIPPNSANSSIDESTIKVQGSVTLVDTALNSSISVANDNWNWVAPATLEQEETPLFTTIYGTLLSSNEVKNALVTLSAADVTVLHLHKKLDTISEFVIASGKSRRHLMKMADTLVEALQKRNLKIAPGFSGAEGGTDDDWIVVDCHNLVVHLMMPRIRKAINLEDHWGKAQQPFVQFSANEVVYDSNFDRVLEKFPLSPDYDPSPDDDKPTSRSVKKF